MLPLCIDSGDIVRPGAACRLASGWCHNINSGHELAKSINQKRARRDRPALSTLAKNDASNEY